MLKTKDGLKDFYEDPNFKTVWLRGIARFEGLQSREWFEKKAEELKGTKYEPFLKQAIQYTKDLRESDRLAFNKQFKTVLKVAKGWAAIGKKLDDELIHLHDELSKLHVGDKVLKLSS